MIKTIKDFERNPNEEKFPQEIIERIFIKNENKLKVFREFRNLTVSELAKKASISSSYISNLEAGKRKGSYEYLSKLAKALNLDVEDIA